MQPRIIHLLSDPHTPVTPLARTRPRGLRLRFLGAACLGLATSLLPIPASAQLAQANVPAGTNPAAPAYVVAAQGANHQVWQQVVPVSTNRQKRVSYRTNSVTELNTGLHHLVNGQWVASTENIDITADGGQATNGQHSVHWNANANTAGAVTLTMTNGQSLTSEIMALGYFDPAIPTNVLIALPKDSIGQVVNSNQVIYLDAFNGVKADLLYEYRRGGFEQNVVVREQLPPPASFGLGPRTRLQLWTEFINPPAPQITVQADSDQYLDFGPMQMAAGKAFVIGDEADSAPVRKQWVTSTNSGRTFLIEEVQLSAVAAQMESLPPPSGGTNSPSARNQFEGFPNRLPPQPKLAQQGNGGLKLASTRPQEKGLVLDYQLVSSTSGYTFQGDTTYYVSGAVTLSGTTTLEGGAVIKYTNGTSVGITLNGALASTAGPYRPAVLTSKNDDSVGQAITGSTGSPANTGATYLIGSSSQPNEYKYLRFLYAGTGVSNASTAATVWHSQFVNCGTAVGAGSGASITLRNVLITQGTNCVYTTGSVTAEHLTADQMQKFCAVSYTGANVTNSIIAGVTTQTGVSTNYSVTSGSGLFQTALAGQYYLANNSTNVNAGSTNINATLAGDLKKMTTFPPVVLTNSFSANTSLSPEAFRDTDTPDLGYHYDPLDYVWNNPSGTLGINGSVTLTLSGGVAFGFTGAGIVVTDSSTLSSVGTPVAMNRLAGVCLVQEQPATAISAYLADVGSGTGAAVQMQFTDVPALGGNGPIFPYVGSGSLALNQLTMSDCCLRGVSFNVVPFNYTAYEAPCLTPTATVTLTNNLFERCSLSFSRADVYDDEENGTVYEPLWVTLGNNLFWRGSLSLDFNLTTWSGYCAFGTITNDPTWYVKNNAFDATTLSTSGDGTGNISADYNGNISVTSLGGTHNVTLSSFTYATSTLGPWYQSTSSFVDAGSTTANLVGLYHYTTKTDQTIEGTSTVDIGFHYVALDGNGNPLDSNGDGIADYLADSNGNGIYNAGVDLAAWAAGTTNSDSTGAVKLTVYTPLK